LPSFFKTYSDTINSIIDSLAAMPACEPTDSLRKSVEGISRSQSVGFTSWTVTFVLALTVMVFVIIYRQRQYIAYRIRDFFSPEELYTFSKPQAVSNNYFTLTTLLLLTCCSLGLILSVHSTIYHDGELLAMPNESQSAGLSLALKTSALIFLFFIVKGILYALINWVFFRHDLNVRWNSSFFFLTGVFCFLLYPFALIELFARFPEKLLTLILLFLFILYEILLFYKLIVNFKAKKHGVLLFFLYFCAVEVLPALLVLQKIR
jgi:hypothetical protein